MKKPIIGTALVIALVFITPAFAQWEQRARVAVPFEFAVDNTVLPAGTYAVLL